MANHEINEDQDALTRALRMIETGDPVHADVYNALFSVLINNDVFLEKLANKMIQQAMISHVTDCTNSDMVMGADQGPVFTKLIEKVKEQVDVLNTNQLKIFPQVSFNTPNTDFFSLIENYDCAFGNVFQQSTGGTIKNWISNTNDGAYVKIGRLVFACNGWNENANLYVCHLWTRWRSWKSL